MLAKIFVKNGTRFLVKNVTNMIKYVLYIQWKRKFLFNFLLLLLLCIQQSYSAKPCKCPSELINNMENAYKDAIPSSDRSKRSSRSSRRRSDGDSSSRESHEVCCNIMITIMLAYRLKKNEYFTLHRDRSVFSVLLSVGGRGRVRAGNL